MKEGLLWYDDDPQCDLAEKVSRAAKRYRHKFGMSPDVCYVHPSAVNASGEEQDINGVHVDSLMSVLRHHFWLGQEDAQSAGRGLAGVWRPAS